MLNSDIEDDVEPLVVQVPIPYNPRWFQVKIHQELKRFGCLVLHRRAGKTVLAINELIKRVATCPHPSPQGHYVAPFYNQVKRIAWKYLQEFTLAIPGIQHNQSELLCTFPNGATIQLLGGDKYHSHRGIYSDFAVLDEPAQMHPALWGEVFRPALADRHGGALWIGTPNGMSNDFYDRWEFAGDPANDDWIRAMYRVNETGAIDRQEIILASREMSREQFQQEFLCSWTAAILGAYYGQELSDMDKDGRIMSVPWDPNLPVVTSWDLGIRDSTVCHFWQEAGSEVRMIDCEAFVGIGLPDMIQKLRSKPYQYANHIAPHDIKVRELGSGTSRLDIAAQLGVNFDIAPRVGVQDGIQATRSLLKRMVIDREKCSDSLQALRNYRVEYDDRRRTFKNNPLHDWTSDYCDSIRYRAVTPLNINQISLWSNSPDYSDADRAVI